MNEITNRPPTSFFSSNDLSSYIILGFEDENNERRNAFVKNIR